MKVIVYSLGERTCICKPVPWARKVRRISLQQVEPPQAIDLFLRRPVTAEEFKKFDLEYAETEQEFIDRVIKRSVPPEAQDVRVVDDSEIPVDRSMREALLPDLTFGKGNAKPKSIK